MPRSKNLTLKLFKEIIISYEWKDNFDILDILLKDNQLKAIDLFNDNYALNYQLNLEKFKYLENKKFDFSGFFEFKSHTNFQYKATLPAWITFLCAEAVKDTFGMSKYSAMSYLEIVKEFVKRGCLNDVMYDLKTNQEQSLFDYMVKQDSEGKLSLHNIFIADENNFCQHINNKEYNLVLLSKSLLLNLNNNNIQTWRKEYPLIKKLNELFNKPLQFEKAFQQLDEHQKSKIKIELLIFLETNHFFGSDVPKKILLDRGKKQINNLFEGLYEAEPDAFSFERGSSLEENKENIWETFENRLKNMIQNNDFYADSYKGVTVELEKYYWNTLKSKSTLDDIFKENFYQEEHIWKNFSEMAEKKLLTIIAQQQDITEETEKNNYRRLSL